MTEGESSVGAPGVGDPTRVRRKLLVGGRGVVVDGPGNLTAATLARWLGSAWVGPDPLLADIPNGPLEPPASGNCDRAWSLVVSAGPDFLRSHVLGPDEGIVVGRRLSPGETSAPGRWAIDDGTLSACHAEFRLREGSLDVRDLGSRNGTTMSQGQRPTDTVVRLGATTIVCRPIGGQSSDALGAFDFDASTGTWLTARSAVPHRPAPMIDVPLARPGGRIGVRVRPGTIVGSLVGGSVMALVVDPRLAVLALLSPLLVLVNFLDDRRVVRRARRTGERDFASAFAAFEVRVTAAWGEWVSQRSRDFPDGAALLGSVAGRGGCVDWGVSGRGHGWQVRLGSGPVRFLPPLRAVGPIPDVVTEFLDRLVSPEAPVTVDVGPRQVIAVVGPRAGDVVRALVVRVVTGFAPSSVAVMVDRDELRSPPTWPRWLPHPDEADGAPHAVFVQFGGGGVVGAASRRRFRDGCPDGAVIVAVERPEQVPADATTVVTMGSGALTAVRCTDGEHMTGVIADGTSPDELERVAMLVSRWSEGAHSTSFSLPTALPFDDLMSSLEREGPLSYSAAALIAALGTDGRRPFHIDFVADGPHALVAGTTGSGKSELLRTLVAALAERYPSDLVTFVLIDYKGGSAFAECASLPHTVGFVTDLDAGLAARALTCLEAELRRRESLLRETGDRDLVSYAARGGHEPMPRLLVVIDELAALVRDLPSFVPSLVSLAQRGRTLGLHLVLATQRPAGTISDAIRANTNIRVALRVQDPADSVDVIGQSGAAFLDRRCPGRALVRVGPGELSAVQIAAVGLDAMARVTTVTDFDGRRTLRFPVHPDTRGDTLTPLARRVARIADVHRLSGLAPPRQPWPAPLPRVLARPRPDAASVGLVDEPAEQWQGELEPDLTAGSVAVIGAMGSGVTTTLRTIVCALASSSVHRGTRIYVLDLLGRELESLASFHRVGAVIGGHEEERRERLVAVLGAEVATRRDSLSSAASFPLIVVVVDGWSVLRTPGGDVAMLALGDALARLVVEGAGLGLRFVIGTDRATSLTNAIAPSIATRIVLCPADAAEAAAAGVRFSPLAVGVPGRALITGRPGVEVQVWRTSEHDAASAVVDLPVERSAPGIEALADEVSLTDVLAEAKAVRPAHDSADASGWVIPFGVGGPTLGVVHLVLRAGEPFLVCGPPRSGRSTALTAIGAAVLGCRPDVELATLRRGEEPAAFVDEVREVRGRNRPVLVLIDDVERIDDPQGLLARLLADDGDDLRVVVAGRADLLRTAYGHWSSAARRSRHGLALRPNPEVDGDLWQTPLPRRLQVRGGPGRGVLAKDGSIEIVQVARP